jgi:hypothetical protein
VLSLSVTLDDSVTTASHNPRRFVIHARATVVSGNSRNFMPLKPFLSKRKEKKGIPYKNPFGKKKPIRSTASQELLEQLATFNMPSMLLIPASEQRAIIHSKRSSLFAAPTIEIANTTRGYRDNHLSRILIKKWASFLRVLQRRICLAVRGGFLRFLSRS